MPTNKQLEQKTLYIEVKEVAEDGTFSGYGSVFGNVDSYGDIVSKGAFKRTLNARKNKVRLLWQHRSDSPIGKFVDIFEDEDGLRFVGKLNLNVQRGKEAYEHLKHGDLDGMSIGYSTEQADFDSKTGIRTIKEVKLYEISLVTFPANEEATVSSVKSDAMSVKDRFETLTSEQRVLVLSLINNLKQSPSTDDSLDEEDEDDDKSPDTDEEEDDDSSTEHSDDSKPDTDEDDDDPQDNDEDEKSLLHSLKQLRQLTKS